MMRLLRFGIGALLVLTVAFGAVTSWLVATEDGTRVLTAQLVTYVPGLTIGDLQGTFADGVRVVRVEYDAERVHVIAQRVRLQLDLWPLLNMRAVRLLNVHAEVLNIQTRDAVEPDESGPLELPGLPFELQVRAASVAHLEVNDQQSTQVHLAGAWNAQRLRVRQLKGVVAEVAIEASGSISTDADMNLDVQSNWASGVHSGALSARGALSDLTIAHTYDGVVGGEPWSVDSAGTINLSSLPALTGSVEHRVPAREFTVATVFSGEAQTWRAELDGRYAEWPFAARVTVDRGERGWWLDVQEARLADAIDASGQVFLEPELAGDVRFQVAEVHDVLSTVSGDLTGRLRLRDARISGQAEFDRISYAEVQLASGRVEFEFARDLTGMVSLDMEASEITLGEQAQVRQPRAQARFEFPVVGTAPVELVAQATAAVAGETEFGAPRVEVSGVVEDFTYAVGWEESRLAGRARDLTGKPWITINTDSRLTIETIQLTNTEAIEIRDRGNYWTVSNHCWQGLGTICVTSSEVMAPDRARINGRVDELPLARLNQWLPSALEPGAQIDGTWQFQTEAGAWRGALDVTFSNLRFVLAENPLTLPDLHANLELSPARLDAVLKANSETLAVEGAVSLEGLHGGGSLTATGQFQADLAALPRFVDEIDTLEGQISGRGSVQGSPAEPRFEASGDWRKGRFAWSEPVFELSAIDAQWFADTAGWRLSGRGVPGQGGELDITGQGDGYDQSANLTARVEGRDLQLKSELWKITVGPRVDVTLTDGNVAFEGQIDVPTARVEINTLPESLPKPSSDVRVVGREAVSAGANQNVRGAVRVVLGDDVRVKLFALDVALVGELRARIVGEELTSLRGELEVSEGTLSASGQKLKVESGRIMFSGDPNNPYVDLVAVRTIKDQTPPLKVGVRVVGRTDDLQTTVYSEPTMSDTRALSFLVLGRDFNESSDEDSNQLISAAIGLGLKQSQSVVQELQGALGLDELSALAAAQNDVAIVAGKRLTEDLYVRYTYSALSAVGALVIRYHLTDRWRLEATDEESSSMDVMYEFTR